METGPLYSDVREALDLLEVEEVSAVTLRRPLASGLALIRVTKVAERERHGAKVPCFGWAMTIIAGAWSQEWIGPPTHPTPVAAYHAALRTAVTAKHQLGRGAPHQRPPNREHQHGP